MALVEIVSGRMVNRHVEGLALLDEAQPLAEEAGMTLELSRLHHLRGNLLYAMNRATECQLSHEQALAFARQGDSIEAQAKALGGIGDAHYAQARMNTAHEFFARCVALAREHGLLRVEVSYLTMLGVTSCFQMDTTASLQALVAVIDRAQRISHQRAELLARWTHIFADGWMRGNVSAALPHAERVLEIARSFGNPLMEAFYWTSLAMLALREGHSDAARLHAVHAIDLAGENRLSFLGPHALGLLANAERNRSSREEALAAGEKVLSQGAPIHNYFTFYDLAIQSSLDDRQWEATERYCALLDGYSAVEPFIWGQFASALGRALCRVGRGEYGAAMVAALTNLRTQAYDAQFFVYLHRLDAAIVRAAG